MKAIAVILAIFVLGAGDVAHASPVRFADQLDGLSFEYEAREWDLVEGSIGGTVILSRKPKRGSGKIIISHSNRVGSRSGEKSTKIEVTRSGRRYYVSCSASKDDYMFAFFSCSELAKSISIEQIGAENSEDELSRLPSVQSISKSALQRALYMLLAGGDGCSDAGERVRDSSFKSARMNVIADLVGRKKARARKAARGLVAGDAQPIDYILLGLSSSKRSDIDAWRVAYARGRASGSLIDYWQGVVAQREGRVEEAATFFERAFNESQSDLAAAKLAEIAMNAGDLDNARRWWKAMNDEALSKAALTIELARRDNSSEDSLWVFDHYDGAWCGSLGASAATSAAKAAAARGQRKLARSLLKRALAYDKGHGPAYRMLAKMAVEDGQSDEEVAKVLQRYLPHTDPKERKQLSNLIDNLDR